MPKPTPISGNQSTASRDAARLAVGVNVTQLLRNAMNRDGLNERQLARRMKRSVVHVRKLLDPHNDSDLRDLSDAFTALGRSLEVERADLVNHPKHYEGVGGVECIEAIEAMGCGVHFCRANAVKYLWRLGKKGAALEDAKKAQWYVNRLVKQLEATL